MQVQFELFVKDSFSEVGTSKASMNRTGKTNAAKGVHNNYNEYKDFSDRETEAHICAAFMEMSGMVTMDGNYVIFLFISKLPWHPLLGGGGGELKPGACILVLTFNPELVLYR